MRLFAALQFLTTIAVPRVKRESDFGTSIAYFPVVGFILGLILAGTWWVLNLIVTPAIADALVIVLLVLLTGAMHLDGLADTCDGLAGHKTKEERWQIMHDTRRGAFGIVGVALALLVKYAAMNSLPPEITLIALILMPVASRWAMVYAIFAYPYARPSGLGLAFKQGATWPRFLAATVITVAMMVVVPVARMGGIVILLCLWLLVLVLGGYFKSKFGGLTGDTYGAINEIAEATVLILFVALARFPSLV